MKTRNPYASIARAMKPKVIPDKRRKEIQRLDRRTMREMRYV